MSNPVFRYPLDLTGVNHNNLVSNEMHILPTNVQNRAILPSYGPYYTESLIVKDNVTGDILDKGIHYENLHLLEEATIRTGKEVCEVIIIKDISVSNEIIITYQTIGGLYQRTSDAILQLYNAVMNDNRPVHWSNIINKPLGYPPSLHKHLFQDVVGFEPLIVQLERLSNAITLSNVPMIESIIDFYSHGIETIFIRPSKFSLYRNNKVTVEIDATNVVEPYIYYWTIHHLTTDPNDFFTNNGVLDLRTGLASFTFKTKPPNESQNSKEFRIAIRRGSPIGRTIALSGVLKLNKYIYSKAGDIMDMLTGCNCLLSPSNSVTPETLFMADLVESC